MVTNQRLLEEFRQHQCLEVWKNVILWKNSYANKEKDWIFLSNGTFCCI